MSNAFSGRAAPLFVQGSWLWLKIPLLSIFTGITFSMTGCPGFHQGQPELMGSALAASLLINAVNILLIPRISPAFFAEDQWRIDRELLFNSYVILSGFIIIGFSPKILGHSFPVTDQWYKAVIPGVWAMTVGITIAYQIVCFRKNTRRAIRIQSGIRKRNRLAGDKDREFSLPVYIGATETSTSAYEIIYFQNSGQKTTIGFRNSNGEVREGMIERNFKSVRESVRKLSNFYRCHRDWMVNTDKVTGIRPDALGFMLETAMKDVLVPVSSSLNDDLDDRLMK